MNGHISNGIDGQATYSIPEQTSKLFRDEILNNHKIAKDLPPTIDEAASKVAFTGSTDPSIPVNWRLTEAVASLKGLEAALINVLVNSKYNVPLQNVAINTDHAMAFILSNNVWTIDPGEGGLNIEAGAGGKALEKYFPNCDIHRSRATLHRKLATGIYQCSDGKFFNLHGSMNSDPTLDSIGLPHDLDIGSFDEGVKIFQDAVGKIPSEELQHRCTDVHRQAGTICYSVAEFNASPHGQANADVGLWELYNHPNPSQPASWWPSIPSTSPARPLAGLKVVDLTRVIAAPAVTRGLAELGASVMRCTSPNLPDVSTFHPDLNWGKWNCSIDLHSPGDREKLKALILDADVVVQGYRPGALDKYGFSQQAIIAMCASRSRGIISVRENCYGWHGPWQHRTGWQQISDAVTGTSHGYGRALGHGEPVTPIFPHADYCTGIAGTCSIVIALLRRGAQGGSYAIDLALNYYSAWLVNRVGEYPRDVFEKVWDEHERRVWRHYHHNAVTGPETMKKLRQNEGGERLFREEFFELRSAPGILGRKKFRQVKPVARWAEDSVKPGFGIGVRGNGVDAARWPKDFGVEIVT